MTDVSSTPLGSEKKFISISDFYNFIRKGENGNAPIASWYFSVMFYPGGFLSQNETSYYTKSDASKFFSNNSGYISKLRYCIQSIVLPRNLSIRGSKEGYGLGEGVQDLSMIYGRLFNDV